MTYLRHHGYTAITVTQFAYIVTQGEAALPERPVVITFDDGFADFFTETLRILQQYNFTATLYIATGFIGSTSPGCGAKGRLHARCLPPAGK